MLLSAGLPTPKSVVVHGYLTANGQKMSKSLGNVVDPFAFVEKYGLEPTRFYLLKEIPTHSDGDFNENRFKEVYTADLANGLGNLCSRVAKLAEKTGISGLPNNQQNNFDPEFTNFLVDFALDKAIQWIVAEIAQTDEYLSQQKPWKQEGDEQKTTLTEAVKRIVKIAYHLQPFMPQTAQKILEHFTQEKISALAPLFARLETTA